jgi:UDP-glucose 4-epimerase
MNGKLNVIITGAAGLYGTHLVANLVLDPEIGHIYAMDNYSRRFLKSDPFLRVDGFDKKVTIEDRYFQSIKAKELDKRKIDVIIHLAAFISVPESMESEANQDRYLDNNVRGILKLLQEIDECDRMPEDKPLLIYSSSPEVYGKPQFTPMTEEHPLNPCSVYAATKVAAEKLICSYQEWDSFPAVIIRNFNTYGPNQNNGRAGAVTAIFIDKALHNTPIHIEGDGRQTRDFQYVKDAVTAYAMVAKTGSRLAGSIFNIGSGVQTSIRDMAALIVELAGSTSEITFTPGRSCDLMALEADCTKIRKAVGWEPKYTLRDGLIETIRWYRDLLK